MLGLHYATRMLTLREDQTILIGGLTTTTVSSNESNVPISNFGHINDILLVAIVPKSTEQSLRFFL